MSQPNRAAVLVIALAIVVTFLPVLISPYGLLDDYLYLALAENLELSRPPYPPNLVDAAAAEGRPVWGLVTRPVLALAGTIDNLRFVRIITVVGIVALALLLYWALVRSKIGHLPSALIALLACTLPAFQLHAAFTINFPMPWAAFLAGSASLLTVAAVDGPRPLKLDRLVAPAVLLVIAILTYQPTGMFFWVFFAVALAGSVADSGRAVRLARAHFAVAAVGLALAYLGYKLGAEFAGESATRSGRNELLTHDFVAKAKWFMEWAFFESLNLFDLTPSAWLAAFVAAVAAGGMLLWLVRRSTRPLFLVMVALVLIPLTYLPNLVVEESLPWPAYRTQASLSALIAVYFGLGALAIWVTFREWLGERVSRRAVVASERFATAVAIAFVATGVVLANRNVDTLFVEPQMTELRLLRGQVAAMHDPVQKVAFVLTDHAERQPGTPFGSEFGAPSTVDFPSAEPLVVLLLREQGRLREPHPVVEILPSYTTSIPEDAAVVNLNGLLLRTHQS
jgi:hypothetical protein